MIYHAKPQRGGRSIPVNTNNSPQDPPPPEILVTETPEIAWPIDFPESTIVEKPIIVKTSKVRKVKPKTVSKIEQKIPVPIKRTFRQKIVSFFKKLFRRI